jgi:hypothetical protein
LLYVRVADQVSVTYFHLIYLIMLSCLSVHLALSTVLGKPRLGLLTAISVMVCFGIFATAASPYPIIAGTDPKFSLQNVNAILSTGRVPWGQGTGFAYDYSFFPGLEVLASVLSLVSNIPEVVLMKYAGSFLSIVTVLIFLGVYSLICGREAGAFAAVLAALSPWFIVFDSGMVHQTLALPFVGIVLLALCEPRRRKWVFVMLLGVVGVAITHAFTSYVFLFLLLLLAATGWKSGKRMLANLPNLTKTAVLLTIVVVSFWTCFVAIAYLPSQVFSYVRAVSDALFSPEFTWQTVAQSQSTVATKPFWVFALTAVGLAAYFFIALGTSLLVILRRKSWDRTGVRFALGGFVIFGLLLIPYLAGLRVSSDLQGRALIYLYFLTAPLVSGFVVKRISETISGRVIFRLLKSIMVVALIFIIIAPFVYYGMPPSVYDRSSPMVLSSDFRLNVGEWQAAAEFSRVRISVHEVYGISLARDFIGALGGKDVLYMADASTLLDWAQSNPGQLIFLRLSINRDPEPVIGTIKGAYYISNDDLMSTVQQVNILYCSGDVLILETR